MYTDAINQIGKGIKKGRKDTDFVLKRVSENFPKIERVRDIVSAECADFTFVFKTKRDDNRILLDLVFLPCCYTCAGGDQ